MRPSGTARPAPALPSPHSARTRRHRLAAGALALGLGGSLLTSGPALADGADVPSAGEVAAARAAADQAARAVASVRGDLAVATIALDRSTVAAQQAAEAFNGARYVARQARVEARAARAAERAALAHVEEMRLAYAEVVRGSLSADRDLTALSSIMAADGLTEMLELTSSYRIVGGTLAARYDELRAAQEAATASHVAAIAARASATRARNEAARRRDDAKAAAATARAAVATTASRVRELVAELARLQGVSVDVAQQRREALARRARERAAQQAEQAAQAQAAQAAQAAATQAPPAAGGSSPSPSTSSSSSSSSSSSETTVQPTPAPTPEPTPAPAPAPTPTEPTGPREGARSPGPAPTASAPSPSSGAAAAIAFARSQLGERYVWGAAGPDAWDCSGLTMGAWGAGGTSLPHYSVAQYEASTPISASERQPGDLVFWASSSDPSSIYHVALYVGDDRIIHAPRTGRPVSEDSLFYWIPPTFYARP